MSCITAHTADRPSQTPRPHPGASRRLIAIASAVTLTVAAAAPTAALASAKKATRLSLPALAAVAPGTSEIVNGALTVPGNRHGVRAARVTLSFRPSGSRSFRRLSTSMTVSGGRFRFHIAPTLNGTLMVSFAGSRSLRAASATRAVLVQITRPSAPVPVTTPPTTTTTPTTTPPPPTTSTPTTPTSTPPTSPPSSGPPPTSPGSGGGSTGGSQPTSPPPPPPL